MSSVDTLNNIVTLTEQLKSEIYTYLHQTKTEESYIDYANDVQFDITHILENVELNQEESLNFTKTLREVRIKRRQACAGKKLYEANIESILQLRENVKSFEPKINKHHTSYQLRTKDGQELLDTLTSVSTRADIEFRTLDGKKIEVSKQEPLTEPIEVIEPLTEQVETIEEVKPLTETVKSNTKTRRELTSKHQRNNKEDWLKMAKVNGVPAEDMFEDGYYPFKINRGKTVMKTLDKATTAKEMAKGMAELINTPLTKFFITRQAKMWVLKRENVILKRTTKLDNLIEYFEKQTGRLLIHESCLHLFMNHIVENYSATTSGGLTKIS